MHKSLITTWLIILFLTACSVSPTSPANEDVLPATQPVSTYETVIEPTQELTSGTDTTPLNCLDGEVSPIGQSIAAEYTFTSYEEVITWFCNGAEFEDILVALETESQTGTLAEEMLQMLADGFTWEEIWQLTGLTE
jgi:hypothetical protein